MKERWASGGVILVVLFGLFVLLAFAQRGSAQEKYAVRPGDTLFTISKSFGVSVDMLKKANRLDRDLLLPKRTLVIPTRGKGRGVAADKGMENGRDKRRKVDTPAYVVKHGDTLFGISKRTGQSVEDIRTLNHLPSSILKPGQTLRLQETAVETGQDREIEEVIDHEGTTDLPLAEQEKETGVGQEALAKWSGSEERSLFVKVVKNFLGVPYRLGGSTLRGIDCSAFVKKIYEIFNVSLPRTTHEQYRIGRTVGKEELEEGDLVFFNTRRASDGHVGIYIGNREFVHASSQNREVKVDSLDIPYFSKHFLRGVRIKEMESPS